MKGHGEISTNYKVSKTLSNSDTLGFIPLITFVNPTVFTLAAYPIPTTDNPATTTKSINSDYFMWIANRLCKRTTHEVDYVIGFTAVRSVIMNCNFNPISTALTSILPYPATTYDAILIPKEG